MRQTARSLITIDNPLPKDMAVTFPEKWWNCSSPHIRLNPVGSISGNSEGVFEVRENPEPRSDLNHRPKPRQWIPPDGQAIHVDYCMDSWKVGTRP